MQNDFPPPGQYPEPPPTYGQPPPKPPASGSSAWKWILIGCGGFLLISLLLVGGCIIAAYMWGKRMMDPENAEKVAVEILPIDIPEGLMGQMGMSMFGVKMAHLVSEDDPFGGLSISLATAPRGQEAQIRGQVQELGRKQGGGTRRRSADQEFKFLGKDVIADVGAYDDGDTERRVYSLELNYDGRLVFLTIQGPAEQVNQGMVQALLDTVDEADGEK